jgi:1-acyl-sn-glycerol-3-phosphate acyltransferase
MFHYERWSLILVPRNVLILNPLFLPSSQNFVIAVSDASRPSVDQALKDGYRIGLAPGGIAEIFQTPESDKEYAIIRKGIFRLALKHQVPVIPIYCFGSSMLLRRLKLHFIEKLSLMVRISLVVFFGKWGLPIPFRQRLLYVIGKPVHPPPPSATVANNTDQQVDMMYRQYCQELLRVFDRHKESYASGWEGKSLAILTE